MNTVLKQRADWYSLVCYTSQRKRTVADGGKPCTSYHCSCDVDVNRIVGVDWNRRPPESSHTDTRGTKPCTHRYRLV